MRLNKFISESGLCSRREADRHIEQGDVSINGKRASLGDQLRRGDEVRVKGRLIEAKADERMRVIALNKPVGIVSTTESSERANIVRFVNHPKRIFPIGRLDKDSQGLILLTDHGDLVNKVLRAGNQHEKEYAVTVDKPVTDTFVTGMASGVPILGTMTRKCVVEKTGEFVFRIVLVQGLNRQIRRMCEHFGYEVVKLVRTRIMHLDLRGLSDGEWRELDSSELDELLRLVDGSSGEAKPGAKRSRGGGGARSGSAGKSGASAAKSGGSGGKSSGSGGRSGGKAGGKRSSAGGKPGGRGGGKPGATKGPSGGKTRRRR